MSAQPHSEVIHTRKEDSLLHRWLPALSIFGTVLIGSGTLLANMATVEKAVERNGADLRLVREQSIRAEEAFGRIDEKLAETSVAAELVTKMAESIGRLDGKVDRNWRNVDSLWEIARANQANIDILAEAIRRESKAVTLQRR